MAERVTPRSLLARRAPRRLEMKMKLQERRSSGNADISTRLAQLTARELEPALRAVCARYFVSLEEVLGRSRMKAIAQARRGCFAAMRVRGLSLPDIGRLLDRDHTTVLAGIRTPERRAEVAARAKLRSCGLAEGGAA